MSAPQPALRDAAAIADELVVLAARERLAVLTRTDPCRWADSPYVAPHLVGVLRSGPGAGATVGVEIVGDPSQSGEGAGGIVIGHPTAAKVLATRGWLHGVELGLFVCSAEEGLQKLRRYTCALPESVK